MKSTAQREAEKPRPSRVLSRVAHEPVNATLGIAMVIRAIMSGGADASTRYRRARALAFGFIGAATLSLVYAARELPEHLG